LYIFFHAPVYLPHPLLSTTLTVDMKTPCSATAASTLYEEMRTDILAGRLQPGRKLQIEALSDHYGVGQTPLREALNRLTSDGLVERRENRGFAVAPISAIDLVEITKTRCWLEQIALRESMSAKSDKWEEALLLAYHRLAKTSRSLSTECYESNPEWEQRHRDFHRALISGCGSRWLFSFCEQLADQLYRYRQLSVRRAFPKRQEGDEHRKIVDAALAGDVATVTAYLNNHYRKTAEIILADRSLFADSTFENIDWDAAPTGLLL
jgi:DNA-binding GntR family transcriptional regulator